MSVGVEHGSSSKAMSPRGLAWPSAFRSAKPNKSRSIRCDGTTVDSAEKILSTRPGNFFLPIAHQALDLLALQVFLRAAQVARNDGEAFDLGVALCVFFLHVSQRAYHHML